MLLSNRELCVHHSPQRSYNLDFAKKQGISLKHPVENFDFGKDLYCSQNDYPDSGDRSSVAVRNSPENAIHQARTHMATFNTSARALRHAATFLGYSHAA